MILNLMRPTPGDKHFYFKWEEAAPCIFSIPESLEDRKKIDCLIVDQYIDVTEDFLKIFPNVKVVASPTTGHTHLKFDRGKVKVISLKGQPDFLKRITSVAEYVFHHILMFYKEKELPYKVADKVIGIVGLGRIGSQVANIASGFGMKILAFDILPKRREGLIVCNEINYLFETSDIITIHIPEDHNLGFINGRLLAQMKPGSLFINTSRASVIDQKALVTILSFDSTKEAICDVWDHAICEPSPINLTVTDHIAGRSLEDRIATDRYILERIKDYYLLSDKRLE